MKNLFLFFLVTFILVGYTSAQPSVVTSELWSHPASKEYYPFHIALSPNGKYASYISEYGQYCHLVDVQNGKRVRTYTDKINDAFQATFGTMKFSPDSRFMIYGIAANGTRYKVVSCQSGDILRTFTPKDSRDVLDLLTFSPDGSRIAFGVDSIIYEWDWEADTIMHNFVLPQHASLGDYSPDGKYLAAIEYDGNVSVIRMTDGTIMCSFNYESMTGGDAPEVSFSSDGQELIILGGSGKYNLTYWDAMTGAFLRGVKKTGGFFSGAISANRKIAVTNSYSTTIWDVEKGTEIKTIPIYNDLPIDYPRNASALELNADGTLLLAFTGYGGNSAEIELYDTQTGELTVTITGTQTNYKPYSKHFSLDDTKLIGVGSSKYKVWDITTGKTLYRTDEVPYKGYYSSVAHSTVSSAVVASEKDTIYIYNDITDNPRTIGVTGKNIDYLEWSNNGEYIAFGYHTTGAILDEEYHSGIGLIDTKSNTIVMMKELQEISPIKWIPNIVESISFNLPDDQLVLLAEDMYAVISLPNFKLIQFLWSGHHVGAVRFAPDGTLLEVGENGWIRYRISSTATETLDKFLIPPPTNSPFSNGFPDPYAISPDTRFCAIGYKGGYNKNGTDSVLVVWDITNKKEVARFRSGIEYAYLAFTPNNKQLISVGIDGTICAWDIEQATTGVEEVHSQTTESRITISPNPASDDFTVLCLGAGILTVRDVLGRVLVEKKHSLNTESIISTQDFTPGVYFVESIENSGNRFVVKIVIHK